MDIQAYFEEWSRSPGDRVRMAVSTVHPEVTATLERIVRGPGGEQGADSSFGPQVPGINVTVNGGVQPTPIGSYATLPLGSFETRGGFSTHLLFHSPVADWDEEQTLISAGDHGRPSLAVAVSGGRLVVNSGPETAETELRVDSHVWYSLAVSIQAAGDSTSIVLDISQVSGVPAKDRRETASIRAREVPSVDTIWLASRGVSEVGSAVDGFNGKIESPSVYNRPLSDTERGILHTDNRTQLVPTRAWTTTENFTSTEIPELKGRAEAGKLHNGAERAVTGHNWDGSRDSFVDQPDQYAAIYFHSDDMIESGWNYNLEFDLPDHLESGVYAVRLAAGDSEDRYPLFVRPRVDEQAEVLFIVPTNTYLAYGNDRFASSESITQIMGHERVVEDDEQFMNDHPEIFGLSCYDVHKDGSPVRYSSRRRPLVNVRPHYPAWITGSYRHFAVDLFTVEWLERSGRSYHVVTDEDVHFGGADLLSRYKTVVTGSHPEYWTNAGLTALETYLSSGGHMMYLGGNGFYWVTSHDPERPWIVEIRRDNGGLRAWDAPNGERNHVHTGEPGGLWRYRGRGPNKVAGIAFVTEGFSKAQPYRRAAESYEAPYSAFFEGIENEVIGDAGYVLGGAAGDECDFFDLKLGSPPQTVVLASATGFGPEYLIVNEHVTIAMPEQNGQTRPDMVRADMVYMPIAGGGSVFSVGSIGFAGAIAWNDFDNDCARLVNNVLAQFTK